MHYKNKKGQGKINEEFRIARSYREENVQYLNYLLGKETWELVLGKIQRAMHTMNL
jgi:hypothetical protein